MGRYACSLTREHWPASDVFKWSAYSKSIREKLNVLGSPSMMTDSEEGHSSHHIRLEHKAHLIVIDMRDFGTQSCRHVDGFASMSMG